MPNPSARLIRRSGIRSAHDLIRNILSGSVLGIVTVTYSVSFAALLFSGPLTDGLGFGVAAMLVSAGLTAIVLSMGSSLRMVTGGPDTPVMAVMSAMALGISTAFADVATPDQIVQIVLFAGVSCTLLTGLILYAIGALRVGAWMRFIPYPVVAGFLAASGWFLCAGAVGVATGIHFDLETASVAAYQDRSGHLLATLAFCGAVLVANRLSGHYSVLPILIIGGSLLIHAVLAALGISAEAARADGWLLPVSRSAVLWHPWTGLEYGSLDWPLLLTHMGEVGAVIGVTALTILLNATGLEVMQGTNADLDREFRTNGLINVLGGLAGGMVGNLSLNRSLIQVRAGATSPVSGIIAGTLCMVLLAAGNGVTGLIPSSVLGGLLLYMGISILLRWVVRVRRRLTWTDYGLVLAIFVLIVQRGYLEGAGLGLVAACLFFAFNYSRIRVIRRSLNRGEYGSYVERSSEELAVLSEQGDAIRILWLQGYLFFGSANAMLQGIREMVLTNAGVPVRWLVLDFRHVSGIDCSATYSFTRLRQFAAQHGVRLAFSSLSLSVLRGLDNDMFSSTMPDSRGGPVCRQFPNLDAALEACEEDILARGGALQRPDQNFQGWLERHLGGPESTRVLMSYLNRIKLASGEALYKQGSPSDTIDMVASGRVSVLLNLGGKAPVRLRSMTDHTVLGEMGFYRQAIRAADVVADQETVVYRLHRDAYERLSREAPDTCQAFQSMIIHVLSERLSFANNEIVALQK
ncbi:MAG: SLC26A/SulP transporter family protein [Rhodobacterales bacterium]|nr:SLC26A/SulP transporter family protein [Rhodobacterales bacterium]